MLALQGVVALAEPACAPGKYPLITPPIQLALSPWGEVPGLTQCESICTGGRLYQIHRTLGVPRPKGIRSFPLPVQWSAADSCLHGTHLLLFWGRKALQTYQASQNTCEI